MAIMTSAQWSKLQASLPPEDRMSYADYLASQPAEPATVTPRSSGIGIDKPATTTPAPTTIFTQPMTIAGITPPPATTKTVTDPLKDKSVKPSAPQGYHYQWIGGTTTGSWKLYKDTPGTTPVTQPAPSADTKTPPVGTPPAFVYNSATGKYEMPAKPTEPGNWVWDNNNGWVNSTVTPGSTGMAAGETRTMAKDTFKNTLAMFFGAKEMSQAWVDALYKSVSNFYNTGSTIDESLNLALQDVRNNPLLKPFTDRFKGVFALQDKLAAGQAITVPTIAEYFKAESDMGDTLRSAGLGELATQDFLGNVIGLGKSVLEVGNLIDKTFYAIDNAPDALKADLQTYFPGVDRTAIAKALLTGKEGWAELDKKVRGVSVMSAAKTQGVNIDLAAATDIAQGGTDYSGALTGFQTVKELERGKMLGQISGIDFGQSQAIGAVFQKNAQAVAELEKLRTEELGRYQGSAGRLASRNRAAGLI